MGIIIINNNSRKEPNRKITGHLSDHLYVDSAPFIFGGMFGGFVVIVVAWIQMKKEKKKISSLKWFRVNLNMVGSSAPLLTFPLNCLLQEVPGMKGLGREREKGKAPSDQNVVDPVQRTSRGEKEREKRRCLL